MIYQIIEADSGVVIMEHHSLVHIKEWLNSIRAGVPLWFLMNPPFPDGENYQIRVI